MSISITQPDNVGITVESDPLALKIASNLSDLVSAPTARTNLGLGATATAAYSTIADVLSITPSTTLVNSAFNSQITQCTNSVFATQAVNWNSYTSGTGASSGGGVSFYTTRTLTAPNALTAGYSGIAQLLGWNGVSASTNFDKPIVISARFYSSISNSNAGLKARYYITNDGGGHTPTATALTRKGFGWEYDYSTQVFSIITHNGTSQTTTAITAFTYITYKAFDTAVYSDGAGNVSLYINGVLYGTATATGVTGTGSLSYSWVGFSLFQDVTTVTGNYSFVINNPKVYIPIS